MASKLIREPTLYIGGRWVPGGGTDRDVENPATEITTGLVTQASRADVDQAAAAAHAALDGWRATPVGDRAAALRRLHKVITDRADCFAALITREQGSPDGYRIIINSGRIGRQDVMHLHVHVVGGPEPLGAMLSKSNV